MVNFRDQSSFNLVFDNISDLVFVLSPDGRCITANLTAINYLGYPNNEILNTDFFSLIKAGELETVKIKWAEQNISQISFKNNFKLKSGNYIKLNWKCYEQEVNFLIIAQKLLNSDGERQNEIEEQVISFIKNAPSCVALFDKDIKYMAASDYWVNEYLKSETSYIGISHFDFYPHSPWKKYYKRALAGEIIKENNYSITGKSGTTDWIAFEIRAWYYQDKSLGGLIITSENITFRKVAHAAVTEKSQMLNGILRNLPVVIYRINSSGIFTQFIGAGLKLLGLTDNDITGRKAIEIFPDILFSINKLRNGGSIVFQSHGIYEMKEWHFENHIFPDNVNNNGIIGFAFDITDSVLKGRAMEAARSKAETADKYKTRFLANMSHEIRTPLNAIIGFAEVFDRRNLSQEQREHLHNINTSGNMLLKLIGDILDLSKIEEGKLSVEVESFNLKELFTSDFLPYKYHANKKGLDFFLKFDENIPTYIIGDASKIKQVIINLIGNALKFTKEGAITVEVSQERWVTNTEDIALRFSVSDTGMGIPIEKQLQIFESFTQGDSNISKYYGGSGLGLSIVKQLVELMDGRVEITSPSNSTDVGGFGSTFWFVLNLEVDKTKKRIVKKLKEEVKKFDKVLSVLVAEDNPMNQALAEVILTRLGCQVTIAENGEEAVDTFLSEKFQLIFMDVQMPLMNGFQATELIRKKYKSSIPIIGLTANVYKEDIEKCLASGMNDYLGKPYMEIQMYQIIKKWVKEASSVNNDKCTNLSFLENSGNGDPEFVKNMVLVFLKENEEFILNIEKALYGKDKDLIRKATHKIKSCYKMIGITSAEPLLKQIESDLYNNDWNYVTSLISKVKLLSYKAEEELKLHLEFKGV